MSQEGREAMVVPYIVVVWGDSISVQGGSWPASAEMWLSAVCHPQRPVKFINSGQCGMPAAQAKEQFAEKVLVHKPDLVIIQFGFNDLRWERASGPISTLSGFASHITEMIRSCKEEAGAQVLVLGNHNPVSILRMPDGFTYSQTVASYREASASAAKAAGARYFDMSSLAEGAFCDSDLVVDDGVHLSEKGRTLYAQQVANLVQDILAQ